MRQMAIHAQWRKLPTGILFQFPKLDQTQGRGTGSNKPARIRECSRLSLAVKASDVFVLHEVEPSRVERLFFGHSEFVAIGGGPNGWPTEEYLNLHCEGAADPFVVGARRSTGHIVGCGRFYLRGLHKYTGWFANASCRSGRGPDSADVRLDLHVR